MKFPLSFRMRREQVPAPRQSESRSLMSGQKQRHHFITQLCVTHVTAIVVLSLKQHRQQIAFVITTRATLGNDSKHDPIDFTDSIEIPAMAWRGQSIIENPFQRRL